MKKSLALLLSAAFFCLPLLHAQEFEILPSAEPEIGEYVMTITGCDWGPAITKAVLNLGRTVDSSAVYPESFSVDVILYTVNRDSGARSIGVPTGSLNVTSTYLCDKTGAKTTALKSACIALEFAYGPTLTDGDPFYHFPRAKSMSELCALRIKNESLRLEISDQTAVVSPYAGQFQFDEVSAPGEKKPVNLTYAWWVPGAQKAAEADNASIPLIIWFHGMGESGSNRYKPLLGTKVTNLISEKIQQYFPAGAAVIAPLCPTGWLESTTTGAFGVRMWANVDSNTVKGKVTQPVKNILGKVFITGSKDKDAPIATVSYYTEAVFAMLQRFLDEHPEIDRNRLYLGGCSAGGYMCLNMLLQAPDMFAAAFPICEAYPDEKITQEQIKTLAAIPLWFTHAKNDTTITPEKHDMLTVSRIEAAGARDLHYVLFDDVHDTSGLSEQPPEDEDDPPTGLPYQYGGHDSWIYVLNDECFDNGESLFAWLSRQTR